MKLCSLVCFVTIFLVDLVLCIYIRTSCPNPIIANGRARLKQRGRWAKFFCIPGFTLVGDKNAFCRGGQWDVEFPKCARPGCSPITSAPAHGFMIPSLKDSVVIFHCAPGYKLKGATSIYCNGNIWDNPKPTCIASAEQPRLFCDFETDDLCQWSQDINHDMDWKRDQFKTPTGYSMPTGPSFDHTRGPSGDGYYMYLETSSRRINDTARLVSPIYEPINSPYCLEFWYHMYGRTIGTLRAYLRKVSESWELNPNTAVFSKTGNQGNVWFRAFVDLGNITEDFQIVMEGARGNSYVSDIAIDDINIIENCDYSTYLYTTEQPDFGSESPKLVESCENRCGERASDSDKLQFLACDCDEACQETSRCCPDFVDTCFDGTTTEMDTTLYEVDPTETNATTVALPRITTQIIRRITTKMTTRMTTTMKPTSKSTKTATIIKTTTARKMPVQIPTRPRIIFLQPTTTQEIYRKTLPTTNLPPAVEKLTTPNNSLTDESYNDAAEIPSPLEDDTSLEDKEDYVERIINSKSGNVNEENANDIETGYIEQRVDTYPSNKLSIIIGVVSTVCIGLIVIGFLWRYRRRRNQMLSGSGDSQSDVRFLTADEVLDFSLDKGYDEL